MKSSLMKLNPVSTFSGEGQIEIIDRFSPEGLGVATSYLFKATLA
jgi:hypothetical protein